LEYLTSSSLVQLDFKSTRLSAAAEFSKRIFKRVHSASLTEGSNGHFPVGICSDRTSGQLT
jgi:hypothetical protein